MPTYYIGLDSDAQDEAADRIFGMLQGQPGMAGLDRDRVKTYLDRKAQKAVTDDFTNSEKMAIDQLAKKGGLSFKAPPASAAPTPPRAETPSPPTAPVAPPPVEAPTPSTPLEVAVPTPLAPTEPPVSDEEPEPSAPESVPSIPGPANLPPPDSAGLPATIPPAFRPPDFPLSLSPEAAPSTPPMMFPGISEKPCQNCGRGIQPEFIVCPFCGREQSRLPPAPTFPPDEAWLERMASESPPPPPPPPAPFVAPPADPVKPPEKPAEASAPPSVPTPAHDPNLETNRLLGELNAWARELREDQRAKNSEEKVRLLMLAREERSRREELQRRVDAEATRPTPPPMTAPPPSVVVLDASPKQSAYADDPNVELRRRVSQTILAAEVRHYLHQVDPTTNRPFTVRRIAEELEVPLDRVNIIVGAIREGEAHARPVTTPEPRRESPPPRSPAAAVRHDYIALGREEAAQIEAEAEARRLWARQHPAPRSMWPFAVALVFICVAVAMVAFSIIGYVFGVGDPGQYGPGGWMVLAVIPTLAFTVIMGMDHLFESR